MIRGGVDSGTGSMSWHIWPLDLLHSEHPLMCKISQYVLHMHAAEFHTEIDSIVMHTKYP